MFSFFFINIKLNNKPIKTAAIPELNTCPAVVDINNNTDNINNT